MPLYLITVTDSLGNTAVLNLSIIIQPSAKLKPLFNPIDNIVFNIEDRTTTYSDFAIFDYFELIDITTTQSLLPNYIDSLTANIEDDTTHTSTLDQNNDGFSMPYQELTTNDDFQLLVNRGYVLNFNSTLDIINLFLPLTSTLFAGDRIEFYPLSGKALILAHPDDAGITFKYQESVVNNVELDNNDALIGFVYVNSSVGWLPQFIYDLVADIVPPSTLNNGLVAAYTFDQNTNDQINTSHLTTTGTKAYTPAIVNDGYLSDGSNALIVAANDNINVVNGSFNYVTDFTIAFFTNNFDSKVMLEKYDSDSSNVEYAITLNNSEGFRFYSFKCRFSTVTMPGFLSESNLGYLVLASFTLSDRRMRIYVKNMQTGEIQQANNTTVPNQPIDGIGDLRADNTSNQWRDGMAMWKRLLTSDEIIELGTGKQYPY